VQVSAPVGEIASATISGLIGDSVQNLSLTKNSGTFTDDGIETEHFDLNDEGSWWYQRKRLKSTPPIRASTLWCAGRMGKKWESSTPSKNNTV
jgi:hypothetical protein